MARHRSKRRRKGGPWQSQRTLYVPPRRKSEVRSRLKPYSKIMDASDKTCMFVDENSGKFCAKPASNKCHLITESAILDQLADCESGKVVELRWTLSGWRGVFQESDESKPVVLHSLDTFNPLETSLEVGKGFAAVGHFACKPHDDVFAPIDVPLPDVEDSEAMFLMAYRSLLFVGGLLRRSRAVLDDPETNKRALRSNRRAVRNEWINQKASPIYKLVENAVFKLGKLWNSHRDSLSLVAQPIPFRSKLRFAAAGILVDTEQAVGIYPGDDDLHTMIVIHVGNEDGKTREMRSLLEAAARKAQNADALGVHVLCEVMKHSVGSVVASPDSYRRLTTEERHEIQAIIRDNSQARHLEEIFA